MEPLELSEGELKINDLWYSFRSRKVAKFLGELCRMAYFDIKSSNGAMDDTYELFPAKLAQLVGCDYLQFRPTGAYSGWNV